MKKITFLALAICFAMNTFAQSDCGDTVIHCYGSSSYMIFNSTVANSGDYITVTINAGDTEINYDDLVIYDTVDNTGNNLYIADGDHTGQVITSTTGSISVWIDGDGSYNCSDGSGGPYTDLNMSISCAPAPSCLAPTDLVTSLITATSADFSWTAGGTETDYEYIVQDDGTGEPTGSGIVVTGATSVTNNNLTAETNYEVYVRSNCDTNGFSTWLGPVTFTTEPAPIVPDYTNNFSMYPGLNWSEGTGETTPSGTSSAWMSDGFGNVGSTGSARVNIYGTGGDEWLITPTFDLSSGGYEINLDVALTDYYNTDADVIGSDDAVYLMQSLDNGVNWTSIYTWDASNSPSNTGDNITVDISSLTSATTKFALFMLEGMTSGGDMNFYVDNFAVRTPPSCFAPAANSMAASLITATSADLSWTAGATETAWNLEYGATDFTLGAGTTVAVTANSYALMGLTANTSYDFYVQADCGANGTSVMVGPFAFTTLCDAVTTFPWTEDFEGITTPSLPNCWSEKNNNADSDSWITYGSYGTSDSNSAGLFTDYNIDGSWSGPGTNNDDYLILPQFALTGNERLKFSVRSRTSGEPNDYKVVLSTSSNAPTDFTTDLMALTVATVTHTEQVIDLSAYSGNVYIAIHVPADGLDGYYLYVDDFTVEAIPSCVEVTDLAVTNLTNSSADLNWTAGATETTWNLEYGATDFTPGAGTTVAVTANTYALMGLTANTSYDFYVQADCDTNGFSAWAGPVTFTTEPDPIVPNYTNDFSSLSDGFWSFGLGGLTSAPNIISIGSSNWDLYEFGNDPDGSSSAYINLYDSVDQWLISSPFDLSGGTYYLNLDAAATEYDETVDAIFGTDDFATLMASTDGGSTWSELYRWDGNNNPGAEGTSMPEIELTGYTASSKFAIYGESANSSQDIDFFVDNFSITATSLGLEDVNTSSNFTYFPNPVNNVLSIKAQASIDSITVYNMLGQTVVRSTPNTTTTAVDMSGLQTGAYFVQVAINNSIETVRVIKN